MRPFAGARWWRQVVGGLTLRVRLDGVSKMAGADDRSARRWRENDWATRHRKLKREVSVPSICSLWSESTRSGLARARNDSRCRWAVLWRHLLPPQTTRDISWKRSCLPTTLWQTWPKASLVLHKLLKLFHPIWNMSDTSLTRSSPSFNCLYQSVLLTLSFHQPCAFLV